MYQKGGSRPSVSSHIYKLLLCNPCSSDLKLLVKLARASCWRGYRLVGFALLVGGGEEKGEERPGGEGGRPRRGEEATTRGGGPYAHDQEKDQVSGVSPLLGR